MRMKNDTISINKVWSNDQFIIVSIIAWTISRVCKYFICPRITLNVSCFRFFVRKMYYVILVSEITWVNVLEYSKRSALMITWNKVEFQYLCILEKRLQITGLKRGYINYTNYTVLIQKSFNFRCLTDDPNTFRFTNFL